MVCAYLVSTTGKTGTQAIQYVQSKRGIVRLNDGFRQQLDLYADRFVGSKRPGGRLFGKKQMSGGISARIKQFKQARLDATARTKGEEAE